MTLAVFACRIVVVTVALKRASTCVTERHLLPASARMEGFQCWSNAHGVCLKLLHQWSAADFLGLVLPPDGVHMAV